MLMSVRVELTCRAWARDSSPSVSMLLLLTDRLTEEWADEWGKSAIASTFAAGGTHARNPQPGEDSAALSCTAPSSWIRLKDRSRTSRVGFLRSSLAR